MIPFLRGILGRIFDGEARSAARVVEGFLRSQYPDFVVHGTLFRAKELERFVFAVTYDKTDFPYRPSPYWLVAVDRESGEASFLETTPESPHWIRGRK